MFIGVQKKKKKKKRIIHVPWCTDSTEELSMFSGVQKKRGEFFFYHWLCRIKIQEMRGENYRCSADLKNKNKNFLFYKCCA